jgi:hypothetical protein
VPAAVLEDLSVDAVEPRRVAAFWAGVLGLSAEVLVGGEAVLRDGAGRAAFRVHRVSEPKTVKNRVHLDLVAADPALPGTTLLSEQDGFVVLADPEGNEFCVFPGEGAPAVAALCTDSARPVEIASWWAALVGADLVPGPDGAPRWLSGAAGLAPGVLWKFVPVDDERVVENRWRWHVRAAVADLVAAGAVVLRERDDETGRTVLADPDGNEFCALDPPSA